MFIKHATQMRPLAAGVGLRPDTTLLSIEIDSVALTATIQQWTGSNFTEKLQWQGKGTPMPNELSNLPNRNLAGQQLSVAVFHVTNHSANCHLQYSLRTFRRIRLLSF
jgi:hypothetical protein